MVLVLGHRGASAVAPENTVEAFGEALRLGGDGVELDVRRSADGFLVVHHDFGIEGLGVIASLCRAELPESVPDLPVVLDQCLGSIVNIELKDLPGEPGHDLAESLAHGVAALLANRRARGVEDRVIVSSFALAAIDAFRATAPGVRTGWLTGGNLELGRAISTAAERGHDAVHPFHLTVNPDLVATAHDRGLAVHTWTVDDADRIAELAAWGVDAIITNDVAVALRALGR